MFRFALDNILDRVKVNGLAVRSKDMPMRWCCSTDPMKTGNQILETFFVYLFRYTCLSFVANSKIDVVYVIDTNRLYYIGQGHQIFCNNQADVFYVISRRTLISGSGDYFQRLKSKKNHNINYFQTKIYRTIS